MRLRPKYAVIWIQMHVVIQKTGFRPYLNNEELVSIEMGLTAETLQIPLSVAG